MTTGRINQVTILGPRAPQRTHPGRWRRAGRAPHATHRGWPPECSLDFRGIAGGGERAEGGSDHRRGLIPPTGSPVARGGARPSLHEGGKRLAGTSATTFWPLPSIPQDRSAAEASTPSRRGRRAQAADGMRALGWRRPPFAASRGTDDPGSGEGRPSIGSSRSTVANGQ